VARDKLLIYSAEEAGIAIVSIRYTCIVVVEGAQLRLLRVKLVGERNRRLLVSGTRVPKTTQPVRWRELHTSFLMNTESETRGSVRVDVASCCGSVPNNNDESDTAMSGSLVKYIRSLSRTMYRIRRRIRHRLGPTTHEIYVLYTCIPHRSPRSSAA
jgi:hypothetical protein